MGLWWGGDGWGVTGECGGEVVGLATRGDGHWGGGGVCGGRMVFVGGAEQRGEAWGGGVRGGRGADGFECDFRELG